MCRREAESWASFSRRDTWAGPVGILQIRVRDVQGLLSSQGREQVQQRHPTGYGNVLQDAEAVYLAGHMLVPAGGTHPLEAH